MNKKNIAVFLMLTLTFGFLISLPYQQVVSATSTTYTQNFESQVNGADFSIALDPNHFMQSKEMTSVFKVSNAQKRSGLLSFTSNTATGYWNLTYPKTNYLTNFSFWYYHMDASHCYMNFYNNTLGVGKPIIYLDWVVTGNFIFFAYEPIPYAVKTFSGSYLGFFRYSFNIDSETGIVTYYCSKDGTTNYVGTAYNSTAIFNNYRIDRVYINDLSVCYYDDFNYTLSTGYGGTEESELYCGVDVAQYDTQIGDIYNAGIEYDVDGQDIVGDYNVPLDTTIRGIGLLVGANQYGDDPTANNYTLTINGVSCGSALCFSDFAFSYINGAKILFWDSVISLDNEIVSYVFTHTKEGVGGRNWAVGGGTSGYDLDGDGDAVFYYNSESTVWSWEWVHIFANIWLPVYRPHTLTNTYYGSDLAVTFWCDSPILPTPNVTYNNSLQLHGWKYRNATGYVYERV